jgi:hypothetical protein
MLIPVAQLAPLVLLLSAAGGSDTSPLAVSQRFVAREPAGGSPFQAIVETYREEVANQVRIEQHVQIRIIARPGPVPFDAAIDDPHASGPRYIEAKVGKCIASGNFASVAPGSGRRLYLFTRDNRIFSVLLERTCEARDFYSGFYLARAADSKLCIERDRLLSRSGSNCQLKQIRELIEVGD